MIRFIHLSDLHIHSDNGKEDNVNCKKVVDHLIDKYQTKKPVILITGDIVDDGYVKQYKNAVDLLRPLVDQKFKVLAVPGNHDYGPLGNIYTEKSQALFQEPILCNLLDNKKAQRTGIGMEDLYPMKTIIKNTLFIGVDSVVGAENEFLHFASGEVGEPQREKLNQYIQDNKDPERNTVVYFHHHPFNRQFVMEMNDASEVLRLLAGKIQVLCFGHDHKSEAYNDKFNIEWMLASGKTTKPNSSNRLQYRKVSLEDGHSGVSLESFDNS